MESQIIETIHRPSIEDIRPGRTFISVGSAGTRWQIIRISRGYALLQFKGYKNPGSARVGNDRGIFVANIKTLPESILTFEGE